MNRVGVVGWPIEHSLSPAMHNAAFRALGMENDWLYDAMAIPPDIADYAVKEPKRHGYIGLNVTIPFKEAAMQWGVADAKARAIGAVNTLDFRDDTATNTDVDGFIGYHGGARRNARIRRAGRAGPESGCGGRFRFAHSDD